MGKENYLRKIYELTEKGDESTTTSELAEEMQVTNASASEAIAQLEEQDLVCRAPYKGFTLSPVGKEKGRELSEKHETLKALFQKIGVEEPDEEAENIETQISDQAAQKIHEELL